MANVPLNNAFKNDGSFLEQFLAGKKDDGQGGFPQQPDASHYPMNPQAAFPGPYGQMPPGVPFPGYPPYGPPFMHPQAAAAAAAFRAGGDKGVQPSRSLWVGSLTQDTTETDLRREFSVYGMIESIKMLLHKNCCFINFTDVASAMAAHAGSFGKIINGQTIRVGYGKVPDSNPQSDPKFQDRFQPCKNLWVGNLSEHATEDDIRREFEAYGRIERIRLLPHKNCAFVNYSTVAEAISARNHLQNKVIHDKGIKINFGKVDDQAQIPRREPSNTIPPFAYPPASDELKDRITATVLLVVRRRLIPEMFEAYLQSKDIQDERLDFLFGGEGHDYYQWKLFCVRCNHPEDQPFQRPNDQPQPPPNYPSLRAEDRDQLDSILRTLEGSKDSIKSASRWIAQKSEYIYDIVQTIKQQIKAEVNYERKLHIFYLVNDVVSSCVRCRVDPRLLDPVSAGFLDAMATILRAVFVGESEDRQERVLEILRMWNEKSFYDEPTMFRLEQQMKSNEDAPPPAPPADDDDDVPPWLKPEQPSMGAPPIPTYPPPPPGYHPPWPGPPPGMGSNDSLMDSVNEFYNDVRDTNLKRDFDDGDEREVKKRRLS